MVERGDKFLINPDFSRMPKSADVVIIGGGMAGPATAWALHRQDLQLAIVLLEKK